jgi:hypothetical protein
MKKNEQCSMKIESERIRDGKRQDICEMVRTNHEGLATPISRIWIELVHTVRRALFWSGI